MSITGSNTAVPYNSLLLQDTNYIVSASFPGVNATGSTTSVNFNVSTPYPTTANVIAQLFNTALTGTTSSLTSYVGLQHSADNVTWTYIPQLTSSILNCTDNGAGAVAAGTAQVVLPPNVKQYVRATAFVPTAGTGSGGIVGSFGLTILM